MTLAENLKKERQRAGMSQKEFADKLGMNPRTYASYERGERDISTAVLLNICKTLNISSDKLLNNSNVREISPYTPESMIPIPVVGKVAAGYTCLAEMDIECYELVDSESILHGYDYIWLAVKGDSMEPFILEGDLVLVRIQDMVNDGDYAVVLVDSEDGLVKQVKFGKNKITLLSTNPYYPPRVFEKENTQRVRIVGKVIESKRKF